MTEDDRAAREARAEEIEQQIQELTTADPTEETPDETPRKESPRDFIHRRMSELEKDEETPGG